jgi:hypothetical protein
MKLSTHKIRVYVRAGRYERFRLFAKIPDFNEVHQIYLNLKPFSKAEILHRLGTKT